MKHTVQNPDGSFTTVDSEDDGMLMYWFSNLFARWIHKKEDKIIKEFPFFCGICNERFKQRKQCLNHIRKIHKIKVDSKGNEILND